MNELEITDESARAAQEKQKDAMLAEMQLNGFVHEKDDHGLAQVKLPATMQDRPDLVLVYKALQVAHGYTTDPKFAMPFPGTGKALVWWNGTNMEIVFSDMQSVSTKGE